MPKHDLDNRQDGEPWADLRSRYGDLLNRGQTEGRWAVVKYRLAIAAVILVLLFFVFMMLDGSIENFRCSFVEFITLECNRWTGGEAP